MISIKLGGNRPGIAWKISDFVKNFWEMAGPRKNRESLGIYKFGHMKKFLWIFIIAVILFALGGLLGRNAPISAAANVCEERPAMTLSFAENFGIDSCGGFRILWVRNGNSEPLRWRLSDLASPANVPENLASYPTIKIPAQKIAILSSTYLGFLEALGEERRIVALDTKRYIADSAFFRWADSAKIVEVGEGPNLSAEALYAAGPDAIFAFSMGESIDDAFPKLSKLELPVVLTSEWTERTPLGKMEWVKFFGALVGKDSLAAELADEIGRRYFEIRASLERPAKERPVVFTGTPASGTWYASAGNSYMANLIQDAGGIYLWESDTSDMFSLSFEKAFADIQKAGVWLNPGGAASLDEILGRESRVKLFPVWKSGEIYEYDLRKGPLGGLDFYESAVMKPESLLIDVAKVLKSGSFAQDSLKWYRKLSNF